jgi:hypothetical protein
MPPERALPEGAKNPKCRACAAYDAVLAVLDCDVEPRDVAGRLALSGEPAMRLRQLSEWHVPGWSEAEAPLGCAVPPERAMCQERCGSEGAARRHGVKPPDDPLVTLKPVQLRLSVTLGEVANHRRLLMKGSGSGACARRAGFGDGPAHQRGKAMRQGSTGNGVRKARSALHPR